MQEYSAFYSASSGSHSASPRNRHVQERGGGGGGASQSQPEGQCTEVPPRRALGANECFSFLLAVEAEMQRRIDLLEAKNERYQTLLVQTRRARVRPPPPPPPAASGVPIPATTSAAATGGVSHRNSTVTSSTRSSEARGDAIGSRQHANSAQSVGSNANTINRGVRNPQQPVNEIDEIAGKMDELDKVLAQAKSLRSKDKSSSAAKKGGASKPSASGSAPSAKGSRDIAKTALGASKASGKVISTKDSQMKPGVALHPSATQMAAAALKDDRDGTDTDNIPHEGRDGKAEADTTRDPNISISNDAEGGSGVSLSKSIRRIDTGMLEKAVPELHYTGAEVLTSQTRFLSLVYGGLTIPTSLPFAVAKEAMEFAPRHSDVPVADASDPTTAMQNAEAAIAELCTLLSEYKKKYEKRYRRLVQELSFSSLSTAERQDIFRMWFDIRRIIDIHETISLSHDSHVHMGISDVQDSLSDALKMITDLPLVAPVDILTNTPKEVIDSDWLKRKVRECEAFNDTLASRVHFASETVLSRTVMRDLIAEMKKCTVDSKATRMGIGATPSGSPGVVASRVPRVDSDDNTAEWRAVMSKYRDVWGCLVDVKKEGTVSFVSK